MRIQFSPPDISNEEIKAVQSVLESGWLTTGSQTKEFEKQLAAYCNTKRVVALNSATAALEMCLRLLSIGPGDEVITSVYTYTASASVICHVGATPVLVDVSKDSYYIDPEALVDAITERTKAIIPVDYAGAMCDYDSIRAVLDTQKQLYRPRKGTLQEAFDAPVILADGAHSFGALYRGEKSGSVADFTAFSFHAVKNLTTGEGGALTWKIRSGLDDDELYQNLMLLSLHGQTKDALSKNKAGSWEYDIVAPNYKCNMTDIGAALGLVQLQRYASLLDKRHKIIKRYSKGFEDMYGDKLSYTSPLAVECLSTPAEQGLQILSHASDVFFSSGHLFPVRIMGYSLEQRNSFIEAMAEHGVPCNVHYKPLPLLSAYRNKGFKIDDFPHAYGQYVNEVTLPLHTLLQEEELEFILECFKKCLAGSNQ